MGSTPDFLQNRRRHVYMDDLMQRSELFLVECSRLEISSTIETDARERRRRDCLALCTLQTQPIDKPVPVNNCWHEPWPAGIQWPACKRQVVKSRVALAIIKHLVAELIAKKR